MLFHKIWCIIDFTPVCWNWQTRWTQNPLVAIPCGFKSRHRHHVGASFACSDFLCKKINHNAASFLLFRKRSRTRQLFVCKRTHKSKGTLKFDFTVFFVKSCKNSRIASEQAKMCAPFLQKGGAYIIGCLVAEADLPVRYFINYGE